MDAAPPVSRSSSLRGGLEQRDAVLAGDLQRLPDPVVGVDPLGDVAAWSPGPRRAAPRRRGCARTTHSGPPVVPPGAPGRRPCAADASGRRSAWPAAAAACAAARALRCAGWLGALGRLGRRALALAGALRRCAAGADGRALLRAGLAHRAPALGCCRPSGSSLRRSAPRAGRTGCPRPRRRRRSAGRGSRRRRRSPCARAPRRAPAARPATSASTTPCRSSTRPTAATTAGRDGSRPSTSSIAGTDAQVAAQRVGVGPSASAVLPARTHVVHDGERRRHRRGRRPSPRRTRRTSTPAGRRSARPDLGGAGARSPRSAGTPTAASSQRLRRELDDRAVVRGAEVVAQLDRPHLLDDLGHEQRVAERLAHLLAAEVDPARCASSSARTAGPAAVDCASSFSWCGKRRSRPPPWMSKLGAEVLADHRRALEVPARPAAAPRRRPGRRLGLARLVALPEREVARVALAARVGVLGRRPCRRSAGRTARRTSARTARRSRRRRSRRRRRRRARASISSVISSTISGMCPVARGS